MSMKGSSPAPGGPESRAWTAREGTAADIPRINDLYRTVFGIDRTDAAMKWRFFENPAGPPIIMIAEAEGMLVGHRVLWPIPITVGLETIAGAQSVDAMTHPSYRRRGIYSQLDVAVRALAARRGLPLLYGFPNDQSYPASVERLGWEHLGNVQTFSRPVRSDAIERVPPMLRPLVSVALRLWPRAATDQFAIRTGMPDDEDIVALLTHRSGDRIGCQTARSGAWYRWRFAPEAAGHYEWISAARDGRTEAFAVWGRSADGREARLAEVVGASEPAVAAVVASVIDRAAASGSVTVNAISSREELRNALLVNGFRRSGVLPFKVLATTSRPFAADFHSFANWRLFGADFDVY